MSNLFSEQSPWRNRSVAIGSILFAASMFAACGDEVTKVTEATEVTQVVGMQVVKEGDSLPKCSAENEGAMVYSVDSSAAYYCVNKKWTALKGKDGKDGVDGKDGKDGADGKNGKDGKNGTNGTDGTNGSSESSCTAVAIDNGYKIVCGGDSVGVVLNGKDGQDGAKGDSGATGNNGLSAYEIAKAGGYTGTEEEWIASLKGEQGAKGDSGAAGTSCSAEEVAGGVKISCTDGKSFMLHNGADGKDGKSFIETVTIDSRDKQIYRVVTIGEQIWMAENLNYKTENSYCYGETASDPKTENCTKYGRLYLWSAAVGRSEEDCGEGKTCGLSGKVRGVCPEGWHLPDISEWNNLFAAMGEQNTAGKMLKSQTGWKDDDGTSGNGTDAYGFSAFPAGGRYGNGNFYDVGGLAYFWSASEGGNSAYGMALYYRSEAVFFDKYDKYFAFSVRCVKD